MTYINQITFISFDAPTGVIHAAQKEGKLIYVFPGGSASLVDAKRQMLSWIQKKFPDFGVKESGNDDPYNKLLEAAGNQILEYFNGKRKHFDIPYEMTGTDFQKSIWREIEKIPYGSVISYGELAVNAGNPGAARAAGGACGKNHLPIIIPCHRVIASDGTLGGFTGGLNLKSYLLKIETSD
ncbi:MAG: methylated-DNA--[protein]-cysteine S-methyltransferase [Candidatus Eremiobacteraeota bacterium]|nr:methylated-DNA--[protein]-cysteine S-methyltransferase [Candidatus Eremiobacteraeota bacterium]